MISPPIGCSCSEITVYPKNWNLKGASLAKDWYIQYYFHDPSFKTDPKLKYGKLCIVKGGINRFKTLAERRNAVKVLMDNELNIVLKSEAYNPITRTKRTSNQEDDPVKLNLVDALTYTVGKLVCSKHTQEDLKSVLKYVIKAAKFLQLDFLPIDQVKRKHVKLILEKCGEIKPRWSPNTFNSYRAYLSMRSAEYTP
ncbi:hypothetical protein EXU57_22210 [Segetibacter sp. 3557_3]|uniref:hypothetical protein n=1 Tax=Segetibacter sp. 3557_3 TaxID=2547429 RepID=UPI00105888B5|nr:hypothetical protein [Segetibacter sp. 3557_3]TDH19777.1 hypothetical protein EXU57_22210 [Segetibacter sp. 3557_3]